MHLLDLLANTSVVDVRTFPLGYRSDGHTVGLVVVNELADVMRAFQFFH